MAPPSIFDIIREPSYIKWLREEQKFITDEELKLTIKSLIDHVDQRFLSLTSVVHGEVLKILNTNAEYQMLLKTHLIQVDLKFKDHQRRLDELSRLSISETKAEMHRNSQRLIDQVLTLDQTSPVTQRIIEQASPGIGFYGTCFFLGMVGGYIGSRMT